MKPVEANQNCGAIQSFKTFARIGCALRFIPYNWDPNKNLLQPPSKWNLFIFNFQRNIMYFYTCFMWFRLTQDYIEGEFSLLAALWALANTTCSSGYLTISKYKNEVMHFANRLLSTDLFKNEDIGAPSEEVSLMESETMKSLYHHMSFNMFLFYANPLLHIYLVYENPCAPNFISSLIFECKTNLENNVNWAERSFFIIFEYFNVLKWQYVVSFCWSCIFIGMNFVAMELKKMSSTRLMRVTTTAGAKRFHNNLKQCELLIDIINELFWYYMSVFPLVGIAVVALLLYGTIRLWRLGPQAVIMFPLCAIRCGFEALTPLSVAGTMSQSSNLILQLWKKSTGAGGKKLGMVMQRNCRKLNCRCGALFSFKKVILLVSINECINQTVNLLVSF